MTPTRKPSLSDGPVRRDEMVRDPGLAARRFLTSTFGLRCPACARGRVFRSAWALAERCPVCGAELERHEGSYLISLALNYFFTLLLVGAAAVLLILWLGFSDWLLAGLSLAVVAVALGIYRPVKGMYLWFLWVMGYIQPDPEALPNVAAER